MAYFNMDHDLDLIEVRESPSVTIERNHDGTLTMWPVIIAKFDTHLISGRFDELHMTPQRGLQGREQRLGTTQRGNDGVHG